MIKEAIKKGKKKVSSRRIAEGDSKGPGKQLARKKEIENGRPES